MVIRIMADDQYRLDETQHAQIAEINRLDEELAQAFASQDEARFHAILAHLIAHIRQAGEMVSRDEIVASDMIVPAPDMTLAETREALKPAQAH